MKKPTPYADDYKKRYEAYMRKKYGERNGVKEEFEEVKKEVVEVKKESKDIYEEVKKKVEDEEKSHPILAKILIFLAFAIPIFILGYAVYVNYLPFGYEKSYEIIIDENGSISPLSDEAYFSDVKGRKIVVWDNESLRKNLILNPGVVLEGVKANVSVEGENVFIGTDMKRDLNEVQWDYEWNFVEGIPVIFDGNVRYNQERKCAYFNAYNKEILYLPNSKNDFEEGDMSVYIRWKPGEVSEFLGNYQQLIGHYNWEIWQGRDLVQFRIGRVNDSNGTFYYINYPVKEGFFDEEHEALGVYKPNDYIEFYVDGENAGRVKIEGEIYEEYNGEKNLSLGWSPHNYGRNPYYDGCVYEARITNEALREEKKEDVIDLDGESFLIPIIGSGKPESVKIVLFK